MSNVRRQLLELPPSALEGLNPELAELLNDRFKRIQEQFESQAGLRGTMHVAAQTGKDARGVTDLGMDLRGGRAGNSAEPIDDHNLVTLGYLNKQLECNNLVSILEQCADFTEALDNENDGIDGHNLSSVAYIFALTVFAPANTGATPQVTLSNDCRVFPFSLPFDFPATKIVSELAGAGIGGSKYGVGIFDSNGNLILQSGPLAGNIVTINSVTLGTPKTLPAGDYYGGVTCTDSGMTIRSITISGVPPFLNFNKNRMGKAANSGSGGNLPSSIGASITPITWQPAMIMLE